MSIIGKITRIKKRSTGGEYIPYPQNFQDALDTAEAQAARAEQAANSAVRVVKTTQELIGGYMIPYFDSGTAYNQYDLVLYKDVTDEEPCLYKALVSMGAGAWDATKWQQTSYYKELINQVGTETVRCAFKRQSDLSPLTGITVTYSINNVNYTATTDSNGYITFAATFGSTYTIIPPAVSGLNTPLSVSKIANSNSRYITITYSTYSPITNIKIVMVDGTEIDFDETLWDTSDNADARLLKLISSQCNCVVAINNSHPNYAWCNKNVLFPSLPQLNTSAQAASDYDGVTNSNLIEYDRTHNLLPSYPDLTIPAVAYCRTQTMTIAGVTKEGYLPAAGQLNMLKNNIINVNTALSLVGGNTIGLGSGYWWSSSQYSQNNAWRLNDGSLNHYIKDTGRQVLPFFDF